jgi:CBS domain containing-hemolysin-like protein
MDRTPARIERLMRPPYFVPPGKALGDLLDEMRDTHQQIAMVVNEYGQLLGLMSLEDLLEELFGELKDEFDVEVPEMTALPGGNWSVAGSIELRKLGEVLGPQNLALADSAEPTLNRLVLRKLGRVPRAGERFALGNFDVTVEKVRGASVELMTFKRAA